MEQTEGRVWREARAMTRQEVMTKASAGQLSWIQVADIPAMEATRFRGRCWGELGISPGGYYARQKRPPSARVREMFARVAGFPAIKTLDQYDFNFATGAPLRERAAGHHATASSWARSARRPRPTRLPASPG